MNCQQTKIGVRITRTPGPGIPLYMRTYSADGRKRIRGQNDARPMTDTAEVVVADNPTLTRRQQRSTPRNVSKLTPCVTFGMMTSDGQLLCYCK